MNTGFPAPNSASSDSSDSVKHSLATAANDFLVASGVGVFVKKTLAEVITLLRTSLDAVYSRNAIVMHATHNQSGTIPASTTYYMMGFIDGLITTERAMPVLRPGTVKNLYVRTNNAQPGTGSLVCTIRKNAGSDTAVTITIAAGAAGGTYTDTTHSFTVVAGDFAGVKLVNNATGASAQIGFVAFEIECDP